MNVAACSQLPRRAIRGVWVRALHPKHLANPLGTAHTPTHSTRFSPGTPADPAFEILYLAQNTTLALFEVQALLGSNYPGATAAPNPAGGAWTTINVQVKLRAIVDFTQRNQRRRIQTTVQELTGDWRAYSLRKPNRPRGGSHGSDVPTQQLGLQLESIPGIEGFLSYSARIATDKTLMVFPRKLLAGSSIRFQDPSTKRWVTIP